MAKRKVNWTQTAFLQKDSIIMYWNERNQSKEYSIRISLLIDEKLRLIASFPEIGRISNFYKTRVIQLENFSIFYKYDNKQILVTTLWDNRQNPSLLFKKLKQ